jgi:hypothetical protein
MAMGKIKIYNNNGMIIDELNRNNAMVIIGNGNQQSYK